MRSLARVAVLLLLPVSAAAEQRIAVSVDPRLELLSVVELLAGERAKLSHADSAYAERVIERFGTRGRGKNRKKNQDLRGAPAVKLLASLAPRGFGPRDAAALALRLGPLPKLDLPAKLPPALVDHAGGQTVLKKLARLLRAFAKRADFAAFVADEQAFYRRVEDDVRAALGKEDYATDLELYFGARQGGYHLVVAPLYPPETAIPPVASRNGLEIYVIAGPRGGSPDAPGFGTPDEIEDLVLREIGRPFWGGMLSEFDADIRAFGDLFADVAPAMKKLGVKDWPGAFVELGVRAVAARIVAKLHGAAAGDAAAARCQQAGFVFVPALAARLAEYEQSRGARYPDFPSFFPRVMAVFGEARKAKTPPPHLAKEGFDGTLLGALQQQTQDGVIVIAPPGIKDAKLERSVARYLDSVARDVRARRGGSVGVLDEWHAADRDLKGTMVWLFATPGAKMAGAWLAAGKAPAFGKGRVELGGKIYRGKRLQVLQAVRAPEGGLGAIVAMAASPVDLFGADRCIPEGASWAVCRAGKVIDRGVPVAAAGSAQVRGALGVDGEAAGAAKRLRLAPNRK